MRGWGSGQMTPLEILTERESIYRLLPATTQDSMQQNFKSYTLDPATRYRNLNKHLVPTDQLLSLYETDQPEQIDVVNKRRKLGIYYLTNLLVCRIKTNAFYFRCGR